MLIEDLIEFDWDAFLSDRYYAGRDMNSALLDLVACTKRAITNHQLDFALKLWRD